MTLKDFVDRYGSTVAIIVATALLVILIPGNAKNDGSSAVGTGDGAAAVIDTGGGAATDAGAPTDAGGAAVDPATGQPADAGGSATVGGVSATGGRTAGGRTTAAATGGQSVLVGQGPCRSDKRMSGIALYMPPCLKFVGSDNGGATGRGVTRDAVKVIRFVSQSDAATEAILRGYKLADEPAVVTRAFQALFSYGNAHYETYGRHIQYSEYRASGPDSSDEAMKADAVKIANDVKPFAVIGGPKVLGQELAQRGVPCICTVSLTSDFYTSNPPLIFGSLPTADEYAQHVAEYIGKKLGTKPAKFAGDELNPAQGYRNQPRKYGMVLIEGANGRVDPEGKKVRDVMVAEMAKYGLKFAVETRYLYDPGRNQQDITNMIAQLKAGGVTSVVGLWDPLTPIFITQEASRQQYFPEWIMTGTGLSDTTTAGRLYDQNQWRHAFGVSPLWVTWNDVTKSEGYREFHHGLPGRNPGDEGNLINIYRAPVQQVFIGIQMAGPKLNADTFSAGMFSYPRTGGTPYAPLVYLNRKYPTGIKDFVEVFYDITQRGKDERNEEGLGMVMKNNGGKRFEHGQWPSGDPRVFGEGVNPIAVGDPPLGQGPFPHEQDGHKHTGKCLSC